MPLEFYQTTDDTVFVPSIAISQLPPADKVVELEVNFDTMDDGTNHAMFNSKTYNMPKIPTVFTQVEYATQNISAFISVFSGYPTIRLIGGLRRRDDFR